MIVNKREICSGIKTQILNIINEFSWLCMIVDSEDMLGSTRYLKSDGFHSLRQSGSQI